LPKLKVENSRVAKTGRRRLNIRNTVPRIS